jgi:hypothetical protein
VRDDGPGVLRQIFGGNGEDERKAVDYIYQRGCVNYERDPNQRRLHLSAFASLVIGVEREFEICVWRREFWRSTRILNLPGV